MCQPARSTTRDYKHPPPVVNPLVEVPCGLWTDNAWGDPGQYLGTRGMICGVSPNPTLARRGERRRGREGTTPQVAGNGPWSRHNRQGPAETQTRPAPYGRPRVKAIASQFSFLTKRDWIKAPLASTTLPSPPAVGTNSKDKESLVVKKSANRQNGTAQ